MPANSKLINTIDKLQAGDVLLFRSVYNKNLGQRAIAFVQSLASSTTGNYEVVHVGICVGHDENGPLVAHVTESNGFMGYAKQPLLESNQQDKESRSLYVFRHRDENIRMLISERAKSIANERVLPKWTLSTAFKLLFRSAGNVTKPEQISNATICSKFATEILQQCTKNDASYVNVNATCFPNELEEALRKNKHFEGLVYTGNPNPSSKWGVNPYFAIQHSIEKEVDRLSQQTNNKYAVEKSNKLKAALLKSAQSKLNTQDYAYEKAEQLLKDVIPVLKTNTGFGFQTPTSYKNVAAEASKFGLFQMKSTPVQQQNRPHSIHAYSAMLRR